MLTSLTKFLSGIGISISTLAFAQEAGVPEKTPLRARQQQLVPIAAFTANGNLERLKPALRAGLDGDLTVNEIKEVLIQIYAYAGFPRSLNGIHAFMEVVEERKSRGIDDPSGPEPSPVPEDASSVTLGTKNQTRLLGSPAEGAYIEFTPAIDTFLKAHLFGDIFARGVLDFKDREIATLAALASMDDVAPQLAAHVRIARNTGVSDAEFQHLISVLKARVDAKAADALRRALDGSSTASRPRQTLRVTSPEAEEPVKGPTDRFTGDVRVDNPFQAEDPGRVMGATVHFEAGARTAWHSHPLGQTLIVTKGTGLVQREGEAARVIRAGDLVWIPADLKHWHGAAPENTMTHIAIVEERDGKATDWMELVDESTYLEAAP